MGEEGSSAPTHAPPGGGASNTNTGNPTGKKKKKKPYHPGGGITHTGSSFVGKCDKIKQHIYDATPGRNGFDTFARTTTEIADYIASNIVDGGEFRTAMDPNVLAFTPLVAPTDPDRKDVIAMEKWKMSIRRYEEEEKKRSTVTKQAYAIVWGQCSPTVQDRVKGRSEYDSVSQGHDLMKLLGLIRTSMYTGATSKDQAHSLIEAMAHLYNYKQGPRTEHMAFLRTYKALIEAVDHLGGDFGVHRPFIEKRMTDAGLDPKNAALYNKHKAIVKEEFIAKHFILKADPKRFGARIASLQNDYVTGTDNYPKTLSKAFDMVVNYVDPNKAAGISGESHYGMSFYQQEDNGGGRGRGRTGGRDGGGRGGGRGRTGRGGGRTSDKHETNRSTSASNEDDENFEVEEEYEQEIGGRNSNNDNPHSYSTTCSKLNSLNTPPLPTSKNECFIDVCRAEDVVLQHGNISRNWLLLDSCSSTDIVANADLLHDVHDADEPTWVRCNAGRVQLKQKGYLGDYPYPVWYNPKGVANILSLNNVQKHYRVTLDTAHNNAMAVHRDDGSQIIFTPSYNGLYKYQLTDVSQIQDFWSMLTTVQDRASKYSKRAYKRAVFARKLQNIIMRPSNRKYQDVVINHLRDCPVTRDDIRAAEDIFGPNLGSLKGKTVRRTPNHVEAGINAVPDEVMQLHSRVALAIDIMFVNKIPFFVTQSRDIKFGTVEPLPDRQVRTVKRCLEKVIKLYAARGITVESIFADHEFELLRPWFPNINTTAANEHVPEIERYIRTIKDRTRSAYNTLPYRHLPRIVLIHLVKNAVFWVNAFPHDDGITKQYSPRYIMTGQQLSYKKHAVIEFGTYVQTHEEHTNDMTQRTMGCICLGPTGNREGGHWFMSLTSGERVVRYKWTELPMPQEVVDRVSQIGRGQSMPSSLTYANRHGDEIADAIRDIGESDDGMDTDSDDDSYEGSDGTSDDDDDDDYESEALDDDNTTDDEHEVVSEPGESQEWREPFDTHSGQNATADSGVDMSGSDTSDSEGSENEEVIGDDRATISTAYDQFRTAIDEGRQRATRADGPRLQRQKTHRRDPDFLYANIQSALRNIKGHESHVTAQMTAKAGLRIFGEKGSEAIMKELDQLIVMNVITGCLPGSLNKTQKQKALKYLMFLKEKRCGRIKGRGCADGRKQRLYKTKEETSSPTVSVEALFLSCVIDAMEGRDVATCDIPGAFMQADIDEEVHIKFDGELVGLLTQVDPSYEQYVVFEGRRQVIYALLNKALYGTVQASLLFWKRLSSFLVEKHGFKPNPYDHCVVNKTIDDNQCTIVWYVDDLKISHADEQVVTQVIKDINDEFGRHMKVTTTRGNVHNYLGIRMDFSDRGKVKMSMFDYIQELLKECPDDMMKGAATSPASAHLFMVNSQSDKLTEEDANIFHHLTAKLLYLSKRTRPDLQAAVSFLTTRVQSPDVDDWKKLGRCLRFLRGTAWDPHILEGDGSGTIRWWVDASFAVHPDMKSHTGATVSLGKGSIYSVSRRQRLNTTSSTEAELVGVADVMGLVLWTRRFLVGQGYQVRDNVLFQDNMSAMLLEKNGRLSSSRRTRHIDIRYFFVTDNIKRDQLRIQHCPTEDMLADFFTKPLQGTKFRLFRSIILNLEDPAISARKECVETKMSAMQDDRVDNAATIVKDASHMTAWIKVTANKKKNDLVRRKVVKYRAE